MMVEVCARIGSVPTLDWVDAPTLDQRPGEAKIPTDGPAVEVYMVRVGDDPPFVSLDGPNGMPFRPEDARRLAVLLCQAADRADGHPAVVRDVPRALIDREAEPIGPQPARPDHIEAAERGLL